MKIKLDKRLFAVASFVRTGATLADVGTDHAYIPIYLIQNDIINFAVASDINEGPLLAAKKNIIEYGIEDKITLILCNGLTKVMQYRPTDIVIAGMGGELICKILSENMGEILSDNKIRLILQPMTHQAEVRRFLYENGFKITDEKIVPDSRHIYQIICTERTEKGETISDIEALLGSVNINKGGKEFKTLCEHNISVLNKTINGKTKANLDCTFEINLLEQIKNLPTYKSEP